MCHKTANAIFLREMHSAIYVINFYIITVNLLHIITDITDIITFQISSAVLLKGIKW